MKFKNYDQLMEEMSELQAFSADEDNLSRLVKEYDPTQDELSLDELSYVAAAGNHSYSDFLEKLKERRSRR